MPTGRIDDIRTFVRVAELGSFAGAARDLGLSPSAVSKHIALLEERLGVRLLDRTTRHVALTEAGRLLQGRGAGVLADLEDLEAEVRGVHASPRGLLRVSAPQDFGRLYLCDIVAEFVDRFPELRLELELGDRLVDVVEERFDVAIRIARAKDSSLVVRRIGVCARVLCASPGYLERYGRPRVPQDLDRHNCIEYTYLQDPGAWTFRVDGRPRNVQPTGRLKTNAGWAMRAMALAGQGIALLPTFLVEEDLARGDLVALLDDVIDADVELMALISQHKQVSAKVRAFLDFVVASLRGRRWWKEAAAEDPAGVAPGGTSG